MRRSSFIYPKLRVVGTARCAVPAPFRRGMGGVESIVPPLDAAGTAQRAVPTKLNTYPLTVGATMNADCREAELVLTGRL